MMYVKKLEDEYMDPIETSTYKSINNLAYKCVITVLKMFKQISKSKVF